MGFWRKPSSSSTPEPPPTAPSSSSSSSSSSIPSPPPPPPPSSPPKPQTREEAADADLANLLSELDSEHKAATALEAAPRRKNDGVYPDTMSCRKAFDDMYYCYSLGGQFLNVYRYGELRDCSDKTADFRFCLKTKVRGEAAARAMIRQREMEKAARRKQGPSSEDLWEVRKEPLGPEGFSGKLEDLVKDDLS